MDRWGRAGSLAAGVLFAVLLVIGFVLTNDTPDTSDSPGKVLAYYLHHQDRINVGAYMIGLSIVFGLFWFGSLRAFFRRSEAANGSPRCSWQEACCSPFQARSPPEA